MDKEDTIFSDIGPGETEVGLAQGLFTRLIDFAVEILILYLVYRFMPGNILQDLINGNSIVVLLIIIAVAVIYQFGFLLLFNKTIGMMICGVKYLNKNHRPLSAKEKLLSIFRTRFSGIKYYKMS
jgi:uncharacterized RDD family membrane protein YckC